MQYGGNPEEGDGALGFGSVQDSVVCVGGAGSRNHSRRSAVEFPSSCMEKELVYIGRVCIHWNWPEYLEFPRDCQAALAPPCFAQAGVSHVRETALHQRSARQTWASFKMSLVKSLVLVLIISIFISFYCTPCFDSPLKEYKLCYWLENHPV